MLAKQNGTFLKSCLILQISPMACQAQPEDTIEIRRESFLWRVPDRVAATKGSVEMPLPTVTPDTCRPEKGCSESGRTLNPFRCFGGSCLMRSLQWRKESQRLPPARRGGAGFPECFFSCMPAVYSNPGNTDPAPIYSPTGPVHQEPARRGEDAAGVGQGAPPPSSAQMRRLLPRRRVRRELCSGQNWTQPAPGCVWLEADPVDLVKSPQTSAVAAVAGLG